MVPSALEWDSNVNLVHSASSAIGVYRNASASKDNYVIQETVVKIPVKVKVLNNYMYINNKTYVNISISPFKYMTYGSKSYFHLPFQGTAYSPPTKRLVFDTCIFRSQIQVAGKGMPHLRFTGFM